MKNKFSTIYATFASIIFVLTIVYFGFNLYTEYSHGYIRTKKTFDQLTLSLKQNPDTFKIPDLNDYAYIEIMENGTTFYKYPAKAVKNDKTSSLIKTYFNSVKIDNANYFITADMFLLRPASIRFYARNSFVIILIITVITILMIITLSVSEKDTIKITTEDDSSDDEIKLSDLSDESENTVTETPESEVEAADIPSEPVVETPQVQETVVTEPVSEVPAEPVAQTVLPSDEVKPVSIEQTDNNPYGLFSPKSGIGWESYLLTRLDNELNRAISSEFDLALFVIKIDGIENNSDKLREVCGYLTIQFQFKDMLFEYKDNCIVAIKISMSLDEAITFADKLHSDIEDITAMNCYIGISTRTIRIISGERILQEAEEALNHAQEEKDTPIIAFRANAEKYRQYLEQSN